MREAGLAEMHLVVDHPGQQVQAGGVERLVHTRPGRHADVRDPPVLDQNVGADGFAGQHAGGASD